MTKYYSTQRPISIGTFPSGHKIEALVNFDQRSFVENIGRPAWGYIIFKDELTEDEAKQYELVKARRTA
ncbi:MAG: hypothetical protein LIO94_06890 [Clostridiales bacterium]|nr:hypothetical protein [Clostridiales bacterium]